MKVNITKNYRIFESNSLDNRALVPKKHKRLMESMRLYGFLPEFPIVVYRDKDKHLVVKDGQHRLLMAETLKLPVYWVEESSPWDIAKVNSTPEGWKPIDYAERYARQGKKDYQEGIDFMKSHRISIGTAFALLSGNTGFTNIQGDFISGAFKVRDRDWAEAVVSIYNPFRMASKHCRNTFFVLACMAVCRVPEFEPSRLLNGMERNLDKVHPYSTRDAYLAMLEEIYNSHRKYLFPLKIQAEMVMRNRNPKGNLNGSAAPTNGQAAKSKDRAKK